MSSRLALTVGRFFVSSLSPCHHLVPAFCRSSRLSPSSLTLRSLLHNDTVAHSQTPVPGLVTNPRTRQPARICDTACSTSHTRLRPSKVRYRSSRRESRDTFDSTHRDRPCWGGLACPLVDPFTALAISPEMTPMGMPGMRPPRFTHPRIDTTSAAHAPNRHRYSATEERTRGCIVESSRISLCRFVEQMELVRKSVDTSPGRLTTMASYRVPRYELPNWSIASPPRQMGLLQDANPTLGPRVRPHQLPSQRLHVTFPSSPSPSTVSRR
ncbi:hypothetical protein FA13DRAFT_1177825 [Coprinellus micaceus]|uniref:Uncharacterized protein n=1 Tax=Coprinellus micaceus TaxID=71717 RepID=A0A4Y7SUA6_COPMI|nr:hypothetical protein FA13DRAFT_1177825 [Coprinellus micaceus]